MIRPPRGASIGRPLLESGRGAARSRLASGHNSSRRTGGGCTGATSIIPPPFTGNYSEILTPTPRLTLINSFVLFAGQRCRRRGGSSRFCHVAAPPVVSPAQVASRRASRQPKRRVEEGTATSSKQRHRTDGRVSKKTQIEWREWCGRGVMKERERRIIMGGARMGRARDKQGTPGSRKQATRDSLVRADHGPPAPDGDLFGRTERAVNRTQADSV